MRIRINDKWYSVKCIEYYANDKTDFVGNATPKEIKDVKLDGHIEFSYKELLSDFQKLQKKIEAFNELQKELELKLKESEQSINRIDERRARDRHEYAGIIPYPVNWEQRRYEIAKAIYTSDVTYVAQLDAAEDSVYYADKLIDELKKQAMQVKINNEWFPVHEIVLLGTDEKVDPYDVQDVYDEVIGEKSYSQLEADNKSLYNAIYATRHELKEIDKRLEREFAKWHA